MAPTEILAEQHYHNLRGLYAGLAPADRPTVALLTGSTRAAERRAILADYRRLVRPISWSARTRLIQETGRLRRASDSRSSMSSTASAFGNEPGCPTRRPARSLICCR